jgi:hypothetical protein
VNGDGTASGYLYVRGVSCSTPTDGWAAAVKGVALPAIPSQAASSPAANCSPQPCDSKDNVTVSVQSASMVSASDDPSVKGVDVVFSVANNSSTGVGILNTFDHFTLKFGNGDVVQHSWGYFRDAQGQDVPCIRGAGSVDVLAGQQVTNQHLCFQLTRDETGQQMSFIWGYAGPPFVVPLGPLN